MEGAKRRMAGDWQDAVSGGFGKTGWWGGGGDGDGDGLGTVMELDIHLRTGGARQKNLLLMMQVPSRGGNAVTDCVNRAR